MSEKHSFVVVKYPGQDTAARALAVLDQLSEEKAISFEEAIAVYKDEKGKLKIHKDSTVITGRKGGIAGGTTGLIIGTLMGGPILGALVGAATGAALGKMTGLEGDVKQQLDEELGPNDSALCVVIKTINWSRVLDEMKPHNFGGTVIVADLAEGAVQKIGQLAEDPEVAEAAAQTIEELTESPEVVEAVTEELSTSPTPLITIKGIGPVYSRTLKEAGVSTTEDLLEKGSSRPERDELAKVTGISEKLILRWVNMADLFRIKGIGEDYANLLEAAGVDTVPELAQRNPQNLHQKMVELNAEKKLVHRLPGQTQVEAWVKQAQALPRIMSY
jgi:uncharacterized membrane protein